MDSNWDEVGDDHMAMATGDSAGNSGTRGTAGEGSLGDSTCVNIMSKL